MRLSIQALAVIAIGFDAASAAAQPIWIVPRSDSDLEVVRYLDAALPEASVRWDWAARPRESLLVASSEASVLIVDSQAGKLEASRAGEARPFERVFDFALARTDPYAVAVVAAELLALPELPAPPPPAEVNAAAEASERAASTVERANAERAAAAAERAAARTERTAVPAEGRGTGEGGDRDTESSSAVDSPPAAAGSWTVTFSLGAALAWAPSSDLLLVRPTTGVEVAWQTFALELGATPLGLSSREIARPDAELDYARHSFHARLSAGFRVDPFLFALGAGLAIDVIDLGVSATSGNTLASADRIAAVPFAELEARVGLGAGFGLQVRAGVGIDPSARRYLAQGTQVFEESEVFLRSSLALSWGFSP